MSIPLLTFGNFESAETCIEAKMGEPWAIRGINDALGSILG